MGKIQTRAGKAIQNRGGGILASVDAQGFGALLVGENPKDIGFGRHTEPLLIAAGKSGGIFLSE